MSNKCRKWLMSGVLTLALFLSTFSFTFASGAGGGTDPVSFVGAYLTTISNSVSTTGVEIKNSSNVITKPTIKLVFTKNVVNLTVWDINDKAITLADSKGNSIAVTVTRIPDQGTNSNPNEKRNIFIKPVKLLTSGEKYTLTVDSSLTANNMTKLGHDETVTFTAKADTVKPVITGAANKTIAINSTFNPKTGVTAKDNADGDVTSSVKVSGTVNTKKIGTYTLTYSVTDQSGNTASLTRKIKVIDNVKPVISGAANKTIKLNSTFNPKTGVTAKDNVDGDVTSSIKVTGAVNTKKKGTYILTYTVADKSGNQTVITRKIIVQ